MPVSVLNQCQHEICDEGYKVKLSSGCSVTIFFFFLRKGVSTAERFFALPGTTNQVFL